MESNNTFEKLKHINEFGNEFWYARELQKILDYSRWEKFYNVIKKAKTACLNSGYQVEDHFHQVGKMVAIGSNSKRTIKDIKLSRYACYLIVQNADSSKEVIALGQTYFAIKTRKQELSEEIQELSEDKLRLKIRADLKKHNKLFAKTANEVGVKSSLDYAIFQNHGYKGLYGGLDSKDISKLKGLKKGQKILDYIGSTELAANLFRATQTEEKLRRESIRNKTQANKTHFEVGKKVRQTIKELGGTMPEELEVPEKSISELKNKKIKKIK